jgi:zinc/manganese transport system permease protein
MAGDPHSGEQMKDILAGQILWITWEDLMLYSPVFLIVAALWGFLKALRMRLFYVLFALTIPFSVNLIGVYLVFASLILPSLATAELSQHRQFKAYMISLASFFTGLIASYFWDMPSGPAIVITMLVLSLLFSLLFRKGIKTLL